MIKYFSMFSGIGGFEYGMEKSKKEFECVGYCEIDKFARSIYERHYPNHINYGDATRINTDDLPKFELLIGGFPCQAFSISGFRRGFSDCRGTLFFEIARVLKDCRPKYFLFENVKGLLSNNDGKTFNTILKVFAEMGYNVQWGTYNSKDFGVPQSRERLFIKGCLGNECGREILCFKGAMQDDSDGCGKVESNLDKVCRPVLTVDRVNKRQNGRRMKKDGEPMFTLTTQDRHGIFDGFEIRRLTPVECERLQGFSDDYTKYGANGELISDSQRYKCLGNAVTTNVVTWIFDNWEMVQDG